MRVFNNWVLSALICTAFAFIGYITSEGFDWYRFSYLLSTPNRDLSQMYLADFAFLSFLSISVYWIVLAKFAKNLPIFWNLAGMLLAVSAALYVFISFDFLFNILPLTKDCDSPNMIGELKVTVCDYEHTARTWLAVAGAVSLLVSMITSVSGRIPNERDANESYD